MKITELYRQVTDRILADLEAGAAPWVKPWKSGGIGLMPTNYATGRSYHGINIPILWYAAEKSGYPLHAWMTFVQALKLNGHVKKGEKATAVVFTKQIPKKDEDEERLISFLRVYYVFNVAQIDGLPEPEPQAPIALETRYEAAEAFVQATGAEMRPGGDMACYVPSKDFVAMPPFGSFKDTGSYYATALHELGHWSGHKSRLDRDLSGRFGDRSYAAEELIAELTSAFLCAHLNIEGELRHAGYIKNWIELLHNDDRAIFTAASKASQAADYLRSFSDTVEDVA